MHGCFFVLTMSLQYVYSKYMTTIQVRIDEKTKRSAKKVMSKLGLDLSTGIKLFLNQVNIRQGMPFELLTENGFTEKEERAILKAAKEAKAGKNVRVLPDTTDLNKFLKALK